MKFKEFDLLFSRDKGIEIIGKEEEMKKIVKFIEKEFEATETKGWFEK